MKWFVFRLLVTYYHWSVVKCHGYGLVSSWNYACSFDNFFEDVQWRSIVKDAKYSVDEDFSYWSE